MSWRKVLHHVVICPERYQILGHNIPDFGGELELLKARMRLAQIPHADHCQLVFIVQDREIVYQELLEGNRL